MKRIIFVDDEPHVLDGLRRMLRSLRHDWQMEFEPSGPAALEAMKHQPFDIVVSDMKMPGMDGADLLLKVRDLYPETIRIILSGYSEKEAVLKCMGATHQYLSKPCEPEVLKHTLERTFALRTLLGNESLKGLISQMDSLPSLPTLFQEIIAGLQKPDASLRDIGEIIAQDIGMSAKILQIVNSAYFGLVRPITNVGRAVTHLGLETVNALVLSVNVFSQLDGPGVPGFSPESLWQHSMRTAAFAKALARREENLKAQAADDAFMAATLHEAGKLILATNQPERYGRILQRVNREGISVSKAEMEELGATHAEVGAYLIGLWGLPDPIVEAIAYYSRPMESPVRAFDAVTVVHVASALARDLDETPGNGPSRNVDLDYLAELGLEDRLPAWREACHETLSREAVHR